MRITENISRSFDEAQLSVPSPTAMPALRISLNRAKPEPSFKLLPGQCPTDAPLLEAIFISESLK